MSAGLAMLTELNNNPEIYESLADKTRYLHMGMARVLSDRGVPHTMNRAGSMFSVFFSENPVTDFKSAAEANSNGLFNKFFHGMLERGVYLAPSAFETWFITDALTYEDLDATIAAVDEVAKGL